MSVPVSVVVSIVSPSCATIKEILISKINLKKFAYFTILIFLVLIMTGGQLKKYTNRQRPSKTNYQASYEDKIKSPLGRNAYPSGHTLRLTYLLLVSGYLITKMKIRRWIKISTKIILFLLILSVGIASVGIGVHWVSDIIGAYILAYGFYLILLFCSRYNPLASVKP